MAVSSSSQSPPAQPASTNQPPYDQQPYDQAAPTNSSLGVDEPTIQPTSGPIVGCPPSIDDQPPSEYAPYGYRMSEPTLIALLRRARDGEDPDDLMIETWTTFEWCEDDDSGDIVKPWETDGDA